MFDIPLTVRVDFFTVRLITCSVFNMWILTFSLNIKRSPLSKGGCVPICATVNLVMRGYLQGYMVYCQE